MTAVRWEPPRKPRNPQRMAFIDGCVVGCISTLFLSIVVALWLVR